MKKLLLVIAIFSIALLSSCSNEYKAKKIATSFLDDNLNGGYSSIRLVKFDSTKHINKEQVETMKLQMKSDKTFNSNINYKEFNGGKLYYVRLKYNKKASDNNVKTTHTFYIDSTYTGVVAFKNN